MFKRFFQLSFMVNVSFKLHLKNGVISIKAVFTQTCDFHIDGLAQDCGNSSALAIVTAVLREDLDIRVLEQMGYISCFEMYITFLNEHSKSNFGFQYIT